jgi:hypothetical protein
MKLILSIVSVIACLGFFSYLFFLSFTHPDAIKAGDMLILCGLLAVVSYFITRGAFEDVDRERGKI